MKRNIALILALIFSIGAASNICFADAVDHATDISIFNQLNDGDSGVISQSSVSISSNKEDFEGMEVTEPGASLSRQYDDSGENYFQAGANGSEGVSVCIAEEDGNRFLHLDKEANSGYASYELKYAVTPNTKAVLSYRIRFNEPFSSVYTPLVLNGSGGIVSTTYLNAGRFGLNFSGNEAATEEWGATKEISGAITIGMWYTLRYEIDGDTKTYTLNITDESGSVITDLSGVPFRNDTTDFSNLLIQNPSDVTGGSSVDIDDISSAVWTRDAVYYNITAPTMLSNGENDIGVEITNLSGEQKNVGVYLQIYADGEFLKYEKFSVDMEDGASVSRIERIDTSAYYQDGVSYTCEALVLGENGENLGIVSESALSGAESIVPSLKANYTINGLKFDCTTGYDNSTVLVLAPGCGLQEALADPDGKLVYAKTVSDTIMDMSIPVPEQYPEGQYTVVIISVNADGEIAQKTDAVYYCGSQISGQMLSDFNGSDEDTITSIVNKYMEAHPVLTSFDENIKEFYAQNQASINASILSGKPYTSVDGIISILNTVYGISAMVKAETLDEFTALFEAYADLFGINLMQEEYLKHKELINSQLYNEIYHHTGITGSDIANKFNDILSKANEAEKTVISKSPVDIVSRMVDFEDMELSDPGKSVSREFDGENYFNAGAAPPETTVHIAEEEGNKFLSLNKEPNSGYAGYNFNYVTAPSTKAEFSYRIRFNEPFSSGYTALVLNGSGGIVSTTYLNGGNFGLNFSGNQAATDEWGVTKEISGAITIGMWYTLRYEIDGDTKTYTLNIIDENGKAITSLSDVPFRNNTSDFSDLSIASPSDTTGGSSIDIDDIFLNTREQDTVYYNITGPEMIEKGINEIGLELTNLSGEQKNVGVYLQIYADGKFLKHEKFSVDMENGESVSLIESIDTSTYYKDGVNYTCDALVLGEDGENFGAISASMLSGAESIVTGIKADYEINGIKLNGTTGYDNSTVMVLAPGCGLQEALAEPDGKLVYAKAVNDTVIDMDIPVPDGYPEGQYTVVILSVNKQREVAQKSESVYYCGNQIASMMLDDFNRSQDATITSVVNKYMDTYPVLSSLGEDMQEFYEKNQAMVNSSLLKGKPYTSVNGIIEIMNTAFSISSLVNAGTVEEFTGLFEEHADSLDIDITQEEYLAHKALICERLYGKLHNKEGVTRSDIEKEFRNSVIVAEFNTADRLTIESILIKYSSELGIDVSTALYKNNKSTINKAMTRNDVVYNEPEDISQKYMEIIRSLDAQGTSGGSGSAGGGGSTKVTSPASVVSPPLNWTDENTSPTEQSFVDIKDVPWAEESIMRLKKAGIIHGVDNEHFNPNGYVTREEFAKMIALAFNVSGEKKSFTDVADNAWYAPYVSVLAGAGILRGIGGGLFGVGQNLTRQDAAVILERAAKYAGYTFKYDVSALHIFQDEIADYAVESVQKLYQIGVINGISESEFGGYDDLTRAQAAKLIDGLMRIV